MRKKVCNWAALLGALMLWLCQPQVAHACLNDEELAKPNAESKLLPADPPSRQTKHWRPTADSRISHYYTRDDVREEALKAYQASGNLSSYTRYGLCLVYQGQFEKALEVFLEIEKQKPGQYATAANIGTTYELLGQPDQALEWIKKAIEINPYSHEGSEWIHVKILEAQVAGYRTPTGMQLLGLDFGDEPLPRTHLMADSLRHLADDLTWQLAERMTLVKAPNAYMATLLFELGNLCFVQDSFPLAIANYQLARDYGCTHPQVGRRLQMATQADHFGEKPWLNQEGTQPAAAGQDASAVPPMYWFSGGAGLLIVLLAVLMRLRKRR